VANPKHLKIRYLAGTHGNEPASLYTYALLNDFDSFDEMSFMSAYICSRKGKTNIPHIRARVVHPLAILSQGTKRSMQEPQIQDRYNAYSDSPFSIDDLAADDAYRWLKKRIFSKRSVVIDDHNNPTPGLKFARIGSLASRRSVAAAHLLGFNRFVVRDDCFSDEVLTAVVLDDYVGSTPEDYQMAAKQRHAGLARLALETTTSLDDHYEQVKDDLIFYRVIEIPTLNASGSPAEYLEELESITVEKPFVPLTLSQRTRKHLGIQDHESPVSQMWGHDNMSQFLPGSDRRVYFGGIFCQISALEPETDDSIFLLQPDIWKWRWHD
jgi:hypothetical protein